MSFSKKWRRMKLGLKTVLGWSKQGYFIPYRYAASDLQAGHRPVYRSVAEICRAAEDRFQGHLDALSEYADDLNGFHGTKPPAPRFEQDWFPRLDGAMAYALVRRFKPGRIIEVGSGHSTRFMARALADEGLATEITAIDPAPRADIRALPGVAIINKPVQQVDLSIFDQLGAGDVLFIDSSHILMPGTDVDLLFNHVMPSLPDGVLVHIHDITLPDDYPVLWDWRNYNEQQGVVPMITGGGYDLEWSSHYVASRMKDAVGQSVASSLHKPDSAYETSIWLRKRR
ncbi:class I SAM-dependent methyltransferase [Aestuariispira insulae]|uniref:Methyltransferase family protein n=1 Tax=Aestuariispira insulae TaxID=1461337 RepID=A0A3D9HPV1_9PROT|nr:class I SAM-dependent methyltransferase [Aestuariispira insulae]RED51341.1 methyltransferase family protein [Aestuariispira insulae]